MLQDTLSSVALVFIAITLLARCNDLRWRSGTPWKVRAIGLFLAGFSPFGIVAGMWFAFDPTPYRIAFHVGLALVFLTTPGLPPWHKYVFGNESSDPEPSHSTDRRTAIDRQRDENP